MSEILGYDVNGEPLRAGDRVVFLFSRRLKRIAGETGIVESAGRIGNGEIQVSHAECKAHDGGWLEIPPEWLRKLKDDSHSKDKYTDMHKPCGQSFRDLMKDMTRVPA